MAAARSLQVSVKSDSGSDHSESESDSESDKGAREPEPMEVEEGELDAEDISNNRSLNDLLPVGCPALGLTRHSAGVFCVLENCGRIAAVW